MNQNKDTDSNEPIASIRACPYLGLFEDAATWIGYPHPNNSCHRSKSAEFIEPTHQQNYCLSSNYTSCERYQQGLEIPPPPEFRRISTQLANRKILLIAGLAAIIVSGLIGLAIFTLLQSRSASSPESAVSPTSAALALYATNSLTVIQPATEVPPSDTPAPEPPTQMPATVTLAYTATNTSTVTPTSQPTQGPGLGTPFGPDNGYILHTMQTGESLGSLANQYDTSVAVIQKANLLVEGASIWPGTTLVILVGRKDANSVQKFRVIQIESPTTVSEISQQYASTEEDLRLYNELGAGDFIPIGRWLIIPVSDN